MPWLRLGACMRGGMSPEEVQGGWTVGQYLLCLGISPVVSVYCVQSGWSAARLARLSALSFPKMPVCERTLHRIVCAPARMRSARWVRMENRSSEWIDRVAESGSCIIFLIRCREQRLSVWRVRSTVGSVLRIAWWMATSSALLLVKVAPWPPGFMV